MRCSICSNEMQDLGSDTAAILHHLECGWCGLSFREIKNQGWNVWRWSKGQGYGQGILWDIEGLKSAEECREYAKRRMELDSFE